MVPLHALTRPHWDAHIGAGNYLGAPDCTHFCAGPFLWEPLWWAVGAAATRPA